ncbi:hypothetical protein [Microlunatus sp. Y2014]|uniref:hypothetical protein n=1 Tax=Microlunatus sp. Y2014 TaxID=3418488 RepID=UPI003DA791F7
MVDHSEQSSQASVQPATERPPSRLTRRTALSLTGAVGVGLWAAPAFAAGRSPVAGSGRPGSAPGVPRPWQGLVAGGGDLPEWFERNRVPAHLHLGARTWWNSPQPGRDELFAGAGAAIKELGATAYVRFVKQPDCDPWWPSAAPLGANGERLFDEDRWNYWTNINNPNGFGRKWVPAGTDLPAMFGAEAAAQDVSVIGYYSYEYDRRIVAEHPEWVARTPDGQFNDVAYRGILGTIVDFTTPYREIVVQRLLELAERGLHGVYFDRMLLSPWGTFSDWSVAEYERTTGRGAPMAHAPGGDEYIDWFSVDSYHPEYLHWLQWKRERIADTLEYWRDTVKARYPDFVFVGSVTHLPALTRPDTSTRWAEVLDSVKGETQLATHKFLRNFVFDHNPDLAVPADHDMMGLGWTVTRDAADGRPAFIWSGTSLPNTAHTLGWAGGVLSYGNIADVEVYDFWQTSDPTDPARPFTPEPAMRAAFALGQQVGPILAGNRPIRFAALHFSERARDARLTEARGGTRAVWVEQLWPLVAAFSVLRESGVPISLVNDRQLTDDGLAGHQLLFLPEEDDLTDAEQAVVQRFRDAGGQVVVNAWDHHDPERTEEAAAALRAAVEPAVAAAPIRVTGGPDRRHQGFLAAPPAATRRQFVVPISNDFSWIQVRAIGETGPINDPAPPATGVEVAWDVELAAPQAIEAVSGQRLTVRTSAEGRAWVTVPTFDHLAVVVIGDDD